MVIFKYPLGAFLLIKTDNFTTLIHAVFLVGEDKVRMDSEVYKYNYNTCDTCDTCALKLVFVRVKILHGILRYFFFIYSLTIEPAHIANAFLQKLSVLITLGTS